MVSDCSSKNLITLTLLATVWPLPYPPEGQYPSGFSWPSSFVHWFFLQVDGPCGPATDPSRGFFLLFAKPTAPRHSLSPPDHVAHLYLWVSASSPPAPRPDLPYHDYPHQSWYLETLSWDLSISLPYFRLPLPLWCQHQLFALASPLMAMSQWRTWYVGCVGSWRWRLFGRSWGRMATVLRRYQRIL